MKTEAETEIERNKILQVSRLKGSIMKDPFLGTIL